MIRGSYASFVSVFTLISYRINTKSHWSERTQKCYFYNRFRETLLQVNRHAPHSGGFIIDYVNCICNGGHEDHCAVLFLATSTLVNYSYVIYLSPGWSSTLVNLCLSHSFPGDLFRVSPEDAFGKQLKRFYKTALYYQTRPQYSLLK